MEPNLFTRLFQKSQSLLAIVLVLAMVRPAVASNDSYSDKLTRTPLFPGGRLLWVGKTPPSEAESEELWDAFGVGRYKYFSETVPGVEGFIKTHPQSPWVPSLQANMGGYYRRNGYFTLALDDWQAAWNSTREMTDFRGREVADFALVNWLQLLSSLGRTDTMKSLFEATSNRRIEERYAGIYRQSRAAYQTMLAHPEFSYRCGTYALDAMAQVLCGTNYFKQIWEQPSPKTGFSMADLMTFADSNHLNVLAVDRPAGMELVVPSVVHWKQNHYAAIIGKKGDFYDVVDPTFRMDQWLKSDAINAECSGQFMVPATQVPEGWRILTASEAANIVGKGFPGWWYGPPCCPSGTCPSCGGPGGTGAGGGGAGGGGGGGGGCPSCKSGPTAPNVAGSTGMPTWTVLEPWCSIWITDEPLAYQPSKGPGISFKYFYWSQGADYWYNDLPGPGLQGGWSPLGGDANWTFSWFSYVTGGWKQGVPGYPGAPTGGVILYAPGGGMRLYTNFDGTVPEFSTNTRMLIDTNAAGDTLGYSVIYPSGAEDVYTNYFSPYEDIGGYFLSQQIDPHGQSTSFIYTNEYDNPLLLYVVDGDGKTNTLTYTNIIDDQYVAALNVISTISDPYGHTVHFSYDTNTLDNTGACLTNVTDASGLSTFFCYNTNYYSDYTTINLNQLTTPYGTTSFYETNFGNSADNPMTIVTEPNESHQMFLFLGGDNPEYVPNDYFAAIPPVYTDPRYVPTNRPNDGALGGSNTLDNPDWNNPGTDDHMEWANSFYWNRQQFANLSAAFQSTWDPNQMTTNDFNLARLRHWNETATFGILNNLSMERDPSPDGGDELGEMTWYDYPGKPDFNIQGSADTPILTIKVLPDGTEWYQLNQLDQWNNVTNQITTYSVNGTVLTRTNSYVYAANGQDLLQETRADGVIDGRYGYDSNHQLLFMTNALGEVTSYTYNGNEQQTSLTQPNGQVTTNIYGADGHLAEQIVVGISTNYYTWTNDLVYTHTDERGLTVINSWDPLNRLTNVLYPDGTSMSYIYSNLDLVETIDRMGNETFYTYDPIREKTSTTDANGHTSYYGYCLCGALYSITDALNNVTYFIHDNQGNLLQTLYPDGYSVTNSYNLLHQLVSRTDSGGMTVNNWYNNQGLLAVSSNNVGLVRGLAYDIDDRVTNSTGANNVSVGMTYDNLNRLVTRSYPDAGVEGYGYTPDIPGPTSYTNQIGNLWLYGYDSLNRKTNEICVGVTDNQFAYNGAGDLLALTDGNGHTTTWGYDLYGRVTNKVDATHSPIFKYRYDDDNRLTNRWTPAKGTTVYEYDPVGNLTSVTYASSPPISLSYDADNRLTSMVDGIGTTAYSYDQVGQLLSEGGLWPNDTVNYTYQNRLRMQLSLAHPNGSPWTEEYGYDDARRLVGVESSAGQFDYTYDPVKLQRVDQLNLPGDAYITNTFDSVARLLSTALVSSNGTSLDSQNYAYDVAGQRTSEKNTAGDYRNYTYDNEGELISSIGYESNSSYRFMDFRTYAYDSAGNMLLWHNLHGIGLQTYGYNGLNEMTNATMGSGGTASIPVTGSTTTPATNVTVNGTVSTSYADNGFWASMIVTNGLNSFTAIASDAYGNWSTNTSTVNVILTNSFYGYDQNGNLTNDGYKNFVYDDENELIGVWVSNAWSNSFAYDGKMRRRIERDYLWNAGTSAWVETNEVHFIYDGNLVVEERNAGNAPLVSYTRGDDLGGTFQGAGGIGGLLARTTYGQELPGAPSTAFYHADGNGNITALIYPSQQLGAKYLYDPFGNMLAMSGPLMNFNKYRFSSKEWDENSGLYYYGYRFYDPSLQRWPNRDPIDEQGWMQLHRLRFVQTDTSRNVYMARYMDLIAWFGVDPRELIQPEITLGEPDEYCFVRDNPLHYYDPNGLDSDCGLLSIGCGAGILGTIGACGPGEAILPILGCIGTAGGTWAACVGAIEHCDDHCPSNQHGPRRRRNGSNQWANPG